MGAAPVATCCAEGVGVADCPEGAAPLVGFGPHPRGFGLEVGAEGAAGAAGRLPVRRVLLRGSDVAHLPILRH